MKPVQNFQIVQRNAEGSFLVDTKRSFTLPAKFHYAWRAQPPVFVCRDFNDQPLLACYGVMIEAAEK